MFGKKDYQQLMVIRRMVEQFALPTTVEAGETRRADSGLALSSRNGYLSNSERAKATELAAALRALASAYRAGSTPLAALEVQASATLNGMGWAVDYLTVRRRSDLLPPTDPSDPVVALG